MNSLTARGFQVMDLDDSKLSDLHSFEKRINRHLTPYEINVRYSLMSHGDVTDGTQSRLDRVTWAIYAKERERLSRSGENALDEMRLLHNLDLTIRRQKIDFSDSLRDTGSALSKIRKVKNAVSRY